MSVFLLAESRWLSLEYSLYSSPSLPYVAAEERGQVDNGPAFSLMINRAR